MTWPTFISEDNLIEHVKLTITEYGENLKPYDLKKFNKNIVDPIKLIFDKSVYGCTWEEIVKNEVFRQRDKSNNNAIGYFHQKIFNYIDYCEVPAQGWDVIFKKPGGVLLPDGGPVKTIYVEMKNKHNTMNSASSAKTYIKMQGQLLSDDDCACCLVEAIAKSSQNIKWEVTVDGAKQSHRFIRRVSMDKFYEMVTGDSEAFYKLCMCLPEVIEYVIHKTDYSSHVPKDTVYSELCKSVDNDYSSAAMAFYMLGFGSYMGFKK